MPEPDKLVESSKNSLSVHLDNWQDANCPTVSFMVEQRYIIVVVEFLLQDGKQVLCKLPCTCE